MATLNDIAKNIVDRINKDYQTIRVSDIAEEINSLKYSSSNKNLSNDDKQKLLDIIQFKLKYGSDKKIDDVVCLGESEDSTNFIELVKDIKGLVIK